MSQTFTRQALYDRAWAEPMQALSKKLGLSDRGLAKICAAANVPVPARGYWAKLQAGHKVTPVPLPPRSLGQSERVHIGPFTWGHDPEEDAWILSEPIPPPPVFEPGMDAVEQQAAKLVRKAPLPLKGEVELHPQIARLLLADQERERKKNASPYPSFTDGAVFDNVFERRRLKVLNALFTCLSRCGATVRISGKQAREISVTVGDTQIPMTFDGIAAAKQIERERHGYAFMPRNDHDKMRLAISRSAAGEAAGPSWEDAAGAPIERRLREVATTIIVFGEKCVRSAAAYAHTWRINRKAELEEGLRKRAAEEERRRIELEAKREQARIDHLLGQARALGRADRIRAYVARVQQLNHTATVPMTTDELRDWAAWATAQADRIDPVVSGAFRMRPTD